MWWRQLTKLETLRKWLHPEKLRQVRVLPNKNEGEAQSHILKFDNLSLSMSTLAPTALPSCHHILFDAFYFTLIDFCNCCVFSMCNKLAKLGDAIAISKSETINDSLTDTLTHSDYHI